MGGVYSNCRPSCRRCDGGDRLETLQDHRLAVTEVEGGALKPASRRKGSGNVELMESECLDIELAQPPHSTLMDSTQDFGQ